MFHCYVYDSNSAKEERVSEVFVMQGRRILVEDIPASVCLRCGEPTFSRHTTEQVRRMVHGRPNRYDLKRSMYLSMLEEHLTTYVRSASTSSFNFSI